LRQLQEPQNLPSHHLIKRDSHGLAETQIETSPRTGKREDWKKTVQRPEEKVIMNKIFIKHTTFVNATR